LFNKVGTHESGEVSAPIDMSLVKTLNPASRVFILSKLLESCFTRSIIPFFLWTSSAASSPADAGSPGRIHPPHWHPRRHLQLLLAFVLALPPTGIV
jgi:hypothetical protein